MAVFAVQYESEGEALVPDGAEASLPAKVLALETRDIACLSCYNKECMAQSPHIWGVFI